MKVWELMAKLDALDPDALILTWDWGDKIYYELGIVSDDFPIKETRDRADNLAYLEVEDAGEIGDLKGVAIE